jgi:Holliday junction resolvase RusA-like endonuclease
LEMTLPRANNHPPIQAASESPILIVIPGIRPTPQSRPRLGQRKIYSSSSKRLRAYRAAITAAAIQAKSRTPNLAPPYRVSITCAFASPKHPPGTPHTQTPDGDNLAKAVLDALVKSRIIADDRLCADVRCAKVWASASLTSVLIESLA